MYEFNCVIPFEQKNAASYNCFFSKTLLYFIQDHFSFRILGDFTAMSGTRFGSFLSLTCWTLSLIPMWKEVVYFVNRMIRDLLKDACQPSIRFDAMHFAGAE